MKQVFSVLGDILALESGELRVIGKGEWAAPIESARLKAATPKRCLCGVPYRPPQLVEDPSMPTSLVQGPRCLAPSGRNVVFQQSITRSTT
jgi:hypothetical protein